MNLPERQRLDYEDYTERCERIKSAGHKVAVDARAKQWLDTLKALSKARDEIERLKVENGVIDFDNFTEKQWELMRKHQAKLQRLKEAGR